MPRNRASARKAGAAFERLIADCLAEHVDDRIDRRVKTGASRLSQRYPCDNESAPAGAGNTTRGLTRSSDSTREGLAMEATRIEPQCLHCGSDITPPAAKGRGTRVKKYCSSQCRHAARNATRATPSVVPCESCGAKRTLLHPSRAGIMCRPCASELGRQAAAEMDRPTALDRLMAKVRKADSECWEWIGHLQPNGYGAIFYEGQTVRTHRLAYELLVGPIPEGLQIDHLCRNRACCNPEHLEPVTASENTRRAAEAQR